MRSTWSWPPWQKNEDDPVEVVERAAVVEVKPIASAEITEVFPVAIPTDPADGYAVQIRFIGFSGHTPGRLSDRLAAILRAEFGPDRGPKDDIQITDV